MKLKKLFSIPALLAFATLLAGASSCEKFLEDPEKAFVEEADKTPRYVITIHELIKYKRAEMIELDVKSFFGGEKCINKNPFIHSRDIKKIEMIPRPGNPEFFNLKITLTERGIKLWSAMSIVRMENKKLGIVIDGMFYREINPAILTEPETETLELEGPFDPATAKGITVNSERNFKIFNSK